MLLRDFVDEYQRAHGIADATAAQMRFAVRSYADFIGFNATTEHLERDRLNDWIGWLLTKEFAAATVLSRRRMIGTIWRAAFEAGLTATVPVRLRRVPMPDIVPAAWNLSEVRAIVDACGSMKGRFRTLPAVRLAAYYESLFGSVLILR